MALKLIRLEPKLAKALLILAAGASVLAAWFFVRWHFSNALTARLDTKRAESRLVIDWLIGLAPSDPQGHHAAAYLFEKTYNAEDLERSLREYERAAELSPNNYLMWLNLARARSLSGDTAAADAAFVRAMELAPSYASVQWAYGNFLIRNGRDAEGFKLLSKAAASGDYARVAVSTALQLLDGDVALVRERLGSSEHINSALVYALGASERFDEAVETWSAIPAEGRSEALTKVGEKLVEQLAVAKRYRLASQVTASLQRADGQRPGVGRMLNGGFEDELKLRGAGLFEWHLGEGNEPQIARSDTQKRSGNFGLFMIFNSLDANQFRGFSQTVAVEPGAEYEFEGFYRLDIKGSALLKIEIANAATTGTIAATQPLTLAGDWTTMRVRFRAPADADGILVRLGREGCTGSTCRLAGRLSFDDFSIRKL
jgi:hypothetical protein